MVKVAHTLAMAYKQSVEILKPPRPEEGFLVLFLLIARHLSL
jgi:hypothetical protein